MNSVDLQKTVKRSASFEGIGLHTGNKTKLTFKPAKANEGYIFVRTDLPGCPRIRARVENVNLEDVVLQTALGEGEVQIQTVEHVLAALVGLGIDNVIIEVSSNEPPVGDGSARPYVDTLLEAGIETLDEPRNYLEITEPIWMLEDGIELAALPCPRLEVTFKIDYPHPSVGIRSASFWITPEIFEKKICSSRTFCFLDDVEKIKQAGLIQGGSLENAIVIGEEGILNPDGLRYDDEICRHKILDVLGDFALLGRPLKAHVIAVRSGHVYNVRFVRKILEACRRQQQARVHSMPITIETIQKIMPHRYPFLLVDRILTLDSENMEAIGLKNVTVNEPFFQGHWPNRKVMPGVLILEAMAQTGGILMGANEELAGRYFFLAGFETVKFRRPVVPGDQLRLEVKVLKMKKRAGKVQARAWVEDSLACEADITFSISEEQFV
jgi:UDP-3-O-[3-hydroxymyristoyl] N-acetylglucosamine deacetylase/3-hydroxyacyl-[acyl-carrier-protein] dehydratase